MSSGVDLNNLGTLVAVGAAPTLAVIASSYLANRNARRAQEATDKAAKLAADAVAKQAADSAKAQQATLQAQHDAAIAQKGVIEAAQKLVEAAKATDARLEGLKDDLAENSSITKVTHTIVNNQRTVMLRLIADLARRVATDNPGDEEAEAAAVSAEKEADDATMPPPDES